MKDKIKKTITFIGFVVVAVAAILIAISTMGKVVENSGILTTLLPAIFAICFIFSKNDTLKNFGYAISGANLAVGISCFGAYDTMVLGVGLIVMSVASIIYFLELVFGFFGYFMNKGKRFESYSDGTDDFHEVEKYSQMFAEGIITEEEYASLKAKIFAVEKPKSSSIDDLKKWKKLYDKNLISEDEYSSIKAKILK